jgi:hypothetical protein
LLTIGADDGVFYDNGLDDAIVLHDSLPNEKNIVTLRYREGKDFMGKQRGDHLYLAKTGFHQRASKKRKPFYFEDLNIPDHYLIAQNPLISKSYFEYLGGYDCQFDHIAWSSHDFSYRLQRDGGSINLSPSEVLNVDHFAGEDHVPIEISHVEHDMPLFVNMYRDPTIVNKIRIDLHNWKNSEPIWKYRFPDKD